MIGIAVSNTDRLVRLINDILDIERIESGRVELIAPALRFRELIEHAAETHGGPGEVPRVSPNRRRADRAYRCGRIPTGSCRR